MGCKSSKSANVADPKPADSVAVTGDGSGATLSADLVADLQKFGEEGYNTWKVEATPEQKAAGDADLKKFMEDPAHGAAENAAMVEAFKTATGGAERANKDQFTAFYKMVQERGTKRGNWENMTAEFYDKNWSLVTRVDPSKEGASLGDFMAMTEIVVGKLFECKAKDAAAAEVPTDGTVPDDLRADLKKFSEEGYNKWKTEASPEQKAAGNADLKKFEEDPYHLMEVNMTTTC